MTDEQLRRTMEFIVEQQAQFAVNIQRLEEGFKRQEEERIRDRPRLARLEQSYQTVVDLLKNYDSRMDTNDSRTNRVEAETNRLENALARFTEKADSRLNRVEAESNRLENALARFAENTNLRVTALESILQTSMATVAAAQARTDEKLSALIEVVRQDRGKTP